MRQVETRQFADDGDVPNSPLPMLIYRGAILADAGDPAAAFEALFAENGWANAWRDGIYPYQHYHSTSHEVLGIARGEAVVQFGGEAGETVTLRGGDVVVLPAGTGHCRVSASEDFLVVGAYPGGQEWDVMRPGEANHAAAKLRIAKVPVPDLDPVQGRDGAVQAHWGKASRAEA